VKRLDFLPIFREFNDVRKIGRKLAENPIFTHKPVTPTANTCLTIGVTNHRFKLIKSGWSKVRKLIDEHAFNDGSKMATFPFVLDEIYFRVLVEK
jgi:hypothetical protein